ncbi:hypothetical protein AMTRI_Chr13g122010 [Amborella trichopoda]
MEISEDSDAPEEFTMTQGMEQEEEIRKVQKDNKMRVAREAKERRRRRSQKKISASSEEIFFEEITETEMHQESVTKEKHKRRSRKKSRSLEEMEAEELTETELYQESGNLKGMLPGSIVDILASKENAKIVLLEGLHPADCAQSAKEFMKKRKHGVQRSSMVLKNANQALRLLSNSGILSKH